MAAHQVHVEVLHKLATLLAAVDDDAVAGPGDTLGAGQIVGGYDHVSYERRLFFGDVQERRIVLYRHDKDMHRGLGVDVAEGQHSFIPEDDVTRNFSGDDITKDAFFHVMPPLFYCILPVPL